MAASLGWQIVSLTLIVLAYKILDTHFKSKSIQESVLQKLTDMENKVNEVSLVRLGRK